MITFCIDASVLGTDMHLIRSDSGFTWTSSLPTNTYHFTGYVKLDSDWCLDTLLRLHGKSIDASPPRRFFTAMQLVTSGSSCSVFPWQKTMPAHTHRGFTKSIVSQVEVALEGCLERYYRETWVPGNAVLRSLQRAYVDVSRWEQLTTPAIGNAHVVATFKPDSTKGVRGRAPKVTYDRFGTVTGRLTVTSGPNILTLKRENRSVLTSSFGNKGSIVSIDFASLEPRVLLYEAGGRCEDVDLYSVLAQELGRDRKSVKGAVISELYGSSKHALGKALGMEGKELNTFVKAVKQKFRTADLLERIKRQFMETGYVVNRYGRLVKIDEPLDHVMVNYFAQSSGADVALLGFGQVVKQLSVTAPKTRPMFVLHDALILDVHDDELDAVKAIDGVTVPGYVQRFPLTVSNLPAT